MVLFCWGEGDDWGKRGVVAKLRGLQDECLGSSVLMTGRANCHRSNLVSKDVLHTNSWFIDILRLIILLNGPPLQDWDHQLAVVQW